MKKNYTIKDLLVLLLGKVWYIVAASIVCAILALFVSKFVMSKQYQSHVSMYVKSADNQSTGQDKTNVDLQDINASKSLVQTYIVILTDDPVMNEVSDKLLEMYTPEQLAPYFTVTSGRVSNDGLRNAYSMTAVNQTEVLQITATTTNAKLSSDLCNIMADVAPSFLIRVIGAGSVEKIGDAEVYNTPVSPNTTKNVALGFVGGLMVAVLVILVIDFFDNTVKNSDELGEIYQKPIVGEIMNIGGKTSKKDEGSSADRKKQLLFNNKDIPFNIVENYKTMRTNLMFTLSTTRNKIVVVSSPNPSEGKSVTVANLAGVWLSMPIAQPPAPKSDIAPHFGQSIKSIVMFSLLQISYNSCMFVISHFSPAFLRFASSLSMTISAYCLTSSNISSVTPSVPLNNAYFSFVSKSSSLPDIRYCTLTPNLFAIFVEFSAESRSVLPLLSSDKQLLVIDSSLHICDTVIWFSSHSSFILLYISVIFSSSNCDHFTKIQKSVSNSLIPIDFCRNL